MAVILSRTTIPISLSVVCNPRAFSEYSPRGAYSVLPFLERNGLDLEHFMQKD